MVSLETGQINTSLFPLKVKYQQYPQKDLQVLTRFQRRKPKPISQCAPPPSVSAGEGGELSLRPIFQKRGLGRISIFRGGDFFQEGSSFYIRNKKKSQIFIGKKSLSAKMFFSVTTKNLYRESLTKKLVTFKRSHEIKDEKF